MAIGVLAVTVAALLALLGPANRSVAGGSEHNTAAQLADAITAELIRIRDQPSGQGSQDKLDALSNIIPASDSGNPLRLVASRDGLRVIRESEANDPVAGMALRDRFFLVEVRQQPAPASYVHGSGFLAVTLTAKWPYQVASASSVTGAVAADLAQSSVLVLNSALTP